MPTSISEHKMQGGETALHTRIYRLYNACLWHEGDLDHMRRQVRTPDGSVHAFHARRIQAIRREIRNLMRHACCEQSRRSRGVGCPWFCLMQDNDSFPMQQGSPTVLLLAIGLAAAYITLHEVEVPQLSERVTYVVLHERRI